MTVAELIEFLKTQPQELQVAYACHSELCLLRTEDVTVERHCTPRPDGWVQRKRPDMESQDYLAFPGN